MRPRTPGPSTLLSLIRQFSYRALVIIVTVALLTWAQMQSGTTRAAADRRGPTIPERSAVQSGQETPTALEPGKPVEREIAGGQEHVYRIALQPGQFMRLLVEPKGVGLEVSITVPGAKAVETNSFVNTSALDSFSLIADSSGAARLTVRARGAESVNGSYRLRVEVRKPTADDRKRITAERLKRDASSKVGQVSTAQGAIEMSEQALVLWRELGDRYFEVRTLYSISRAYFTLSQQGKAVEYSEQGLAIARETKDRDGQALALNLLGVVHTRMGRQEKAIEYLEQAVAVARELKDRNHESRAISNLANANNLISRYEKAIEYAEQALLIARESKDRGSEAASLNFLSISYYFLGRYEKAIEYLTQMVAIARELKDRSREAEGLATLGIISSSLGRHEKAIEYAQQALLIHREMKNRTDEGIIYNNLGAVYESLGRPEKAIEYYEQSLLIAREVKRRIGEANNLSGLGTAYAELGQHEKAIDYMMQALVIERELKNRAGEGTTLATLGGVYADMDRPAKAIEYYEQALSIAREVKDRHGEGDDLNGLSNAYSKLGRYEKAVEYSEQALVIAREVKGRITEVIALKGIAKAEEGRGNLPRARSLVEEGLQITESMRSEIYNQESRASYFASVRDLNEMDIDLLMRLHKANAAGGFDALAVGASERARARGLLELVTEANTDIRQGLDPALLERERTLSRQLNVKAAAQVQLLSRAHTAEQAAALAKEISQLENDYEQAQAAIHRASPRYAALVQPVPLSLKEIQQHVLDKDTLLLEYSLGDERSYLWAITNNSVTSHELPKREEIEKISRQVYGLLTSRSRSQKDESAAQKSARVTQAEAQLPEAARQLSQMLLGPVAAGLGNRRLVIVADGALQYVPFAMLPEPVGSGQRVVGSKRIADNYQPLVVEHEVISLPSASTLAVQRRELAARKPAPNAVAVFADPVFDRSDERVQTDKNQDVQKAQQPSRGSQPTGDLAGTRILEYIAEGNPVIRRLRFTSSEADAIMSVAPASSSMKAVGFKASRATAMSTELSRYRYVHFATHGLLDSERPGLSALVLSLVDEQGKAQDGFLRANEIYNLNLPAELVVLSACQTGLGKEIKGEGLVGLTRGFMYAGAARVVVSLWSVSDKATSELMGEFYRKMLKEGQRPAEALRAAQIKMWKQKQWESPYYWAAFTLQGEWR